MPRRYIQYIHDSIKGNMRSSNRDGVLVHSREKDHCIFAVLDGVSSQPHSKFGVNIAIRQIAAHARDFTSAGMVDIRALLASANNAILDSKYTSPYTTCTVVAIPYDAECPIGIASVGDTRAYSVSKQYIEKLTRDDSLAEGSNVITKFLGKQNLQIDEPTEWRTNDEVSQLLIATDGLYSLLESNKIEFHKALNLKKIRNVNNGIARLVSGRNNDDASYVFVRVCHV